MGMVVAMKWTYCQPSSWVQLILSSRSSCLLVLSNEIVFLYLLSCNRILVSQSINKIWVINAKEFECMFYATNKFNNRLWLYNNTYIYIYVWYIYIYIHIWKKYNFCGWWHLIFFNLLAPRSNVTYVCLMLSRLAVSLSSDSQSGCTSYSYSDSLITSRWWKINNGEVPTCSRCLNIYLDFHHTTHLNIFPAS